MKLRHQTRSLIFISTTGLILVAVLLIASLHSARFKALEAQITQEAFEVAMVSASNSQKGQVRLNSNWAWWNASYRFLTKEDKGCPDDYFSPKMLWENNLYFAAIIDKDLSLRWGASLGDKPSETLPLTEEQTQTVQELLRLNPILETEVLSGYTIISKDIAVALTACQVLKNDRSGPPVGWLVLASRPDDQWFGSSGYMRVTPGSSGHAPQSLTIFDGKTMLSRRLPGFKSFEPVIFTMIRPAAITKAGNKLLQMSVIALVISGIIIGLTTYYWIIKKFINRIESLKKQIHVKNPRPLRDSVNDEIGDLCVAFNCLLGTIQRQGELHRLESLQDPLTGLANRRLLDDKLHKAVDSARRAKGKMALVIVDLDGFKGVNDTLGHSVGDELLKQIGTRFNSMIGVKETIARIGGDEFAMVAENVKDEDSALAIGRRIREILLQPFQVSTSSLQISASIGVALYPDDGDDQEKLLVAADSAMYRAKRTGAGLLRYDLALDGSDPKSEGIDLAIKEHLAKGLIEPRYEREVYFMDRSTVRSYIIRPNCPGVNSEDLITRSSVNGTASSIDLMILRKALRERRNDRMGLDLSVWHLWNEALPLTLSDIIKDEGFDPSKLELSFDIHCLESHRDRFMKMAKRLASCGVSLSLRDFGQHYVPLESISSLNLTSVKIPSRLLANPDGKGPSDFLLRAMIELAENLKLETVITGIASKAEMERARKMGFTAAHTVDSHLDRAFADDIVNR